MVTEGPYAKVAVWLAILGLIISYLGVAIAAHWLPFNADTDQSSRAEGKTCVSPIMESRPDSPDRLRPPRNLSITWDRSPTIEGRVSGTIHWQNVDTRTAFGLIEVTGRYGTQAAADMPYILDGRNLPAGGLCGHWLRRYNRVDDDTRGVFFDGLWVGETYCFAVNSSDPGGGVHAPYPSIETTPVCEKAPWDKAWGQPALH